MKKVILGTIIAAGLLIPAGVLMATEANTNRVENRQQAVARQEQNRNTETECTGECDGECTMENNQNRNNGEKRGNGDCDSTGSRTMQRLQDGSGENCDGSCENE